MEKSTKLAVMISIAALIISILVYNSLVVQILLSPEDFCTQPEQYSNQVSITGSAQYTKTGDKCITSPEYKEALKTAQAKSKQNAISLCKNSPPQISCPDSCTPTYTEEAKCETVFPIFTEISTSTPGKCQVIATTTISIKGNAVCLNAKEQNIAESITSPIEQTKELPPEKPIENQTPPIQNETIPVEIESNSTENDTIILPQKQINPIQNASSNETQPDNSTQIP